VIVAAHNGQIEIEHQPAACKALAEHTLANHLNQLRDSWEVCFLRAMTLVGGELNQQQTSALTALWQRIQGACS
jgi:hypothetical protein